MEIRGGKKIAELSQEVKKEVKNSRQLMKEWQQFISPRSKRIGKNGISADYHLPFLTRVGVH